MLLLYTIGIYFRVYVEWFITPPVIPLASHMTIVLIFTLFLTNIFMQFLLYNPATSQVTVTQLVSHKVGIMEGNSGGQGPSSWELRTFAGASSQVGTTYMYNLYSYTCTIHIHTFIQILIRT